MKKINTLAISILFIIISAVSSQALPPIEGKVFGITPLVNELSFYKNVDDGGHDRGYTLQVIAINSFKIGTEFTFEFTGDFNWKMAYEFDGSMMNNDHYIELSLVKPVNKIISLNYQRIYSTFENEPVNQFGIRLSF